MYVYDFELNKIFAFYYSILNIYNKIHVLYINEVRAFRIGNKYNNIICKELTIVYCPDISKGTLKSLACVISGKLRCISLSTCFFVRISVKNGNFSSIHVFEKFSCIFEWVRFSIFSHKQTEKIWRERYLKRQDTYKRSTSLGLLLGSHVTMGGCDKAD